VIAVAVVLAALAIAVVTLAQLNRSDAHVTTGTVAVTNGGETVRTFTMEDVAALPSVTRSETIRSSSHPDETGSFTGVPLRELLNAARPGLLEGASMIVTRAADGYVSSLSAEEVAADDSVILAYQKDGESLGTSSDGGTGPFRIIILTDKYGNRCTKWVNEIEVR
jgi:DMSO/TMAO reductase YedYZ molybdopterin-dependent catalytic subunit